jgi:glycogen(starch) synthase
MGEPRDLDGTRAANPRVSEDGATPRTVLMTADTVGGVLSYALELSAALQPHGVRIVLATMGAPLSPSQRDELSRLPNVLAQESAFRLEWMDDPWPDVASAGDWLLGLAERSGADIVHLNGYCHGALPWGRPVMVVGHSCVLSWWRAVRGEEAPATFDRYRALVTEGVRAAGRVIAPSHSMLDSLARDYGPLTACTVIPNGRDPERFRPALEKEPFVLAAGRLWDGAKNLATLARAARGLSWPVRVAGPVAPPDGAAGPIVAAAPTVELLGPRTTVELADLYARASIYALPARYEPFGLSILEAALSGCALILGDLPSLRELWEGAATFVAPDDADALVQAIEGLIADPSRRVLAAEAARVRAMRFSPANMANAYLIEYRRLLGAAAATSTACA